MKTTIKMEGKTLTAESLTRIKGLGSSKAITLLGELRSREIENFADLLKAAREGTITSINGVGEATQRKIREFINQHWQELLEPQVVRNQPYKLPVFWVWLFSLIGLIVGVTVGAGIITGKIAVMTEASGSTVAYAVNIVRTLAFWLTTIELARWVYNECWMQVGSKKIPAQGVIIQLGRPVDAVPMGKYLILKPFEEVKEFPTGDYTLPYTTEPGVYTKSDSENNGKNQPVEIEVTLYGRYPEWDKRYSYPMTEQEAERRGVELEEIDKTYVDLDENLGWGKVTGKELLMEHTYPALAIDNLKENGTVKLGRFLEKAVLGAVRAVVQNTSSEDLLESPDLIENGVKTRLLVEKGNAVREIALPREHMDVTVSRGQFDYDYEQSKKDVEISRKEAEAAKNKKETRKKEIQAFVEEGVSPQLAAMRVGGEAEGEGMSISEIRDLGIVQSLGAFQSASEVKSAGQQELINAFKKLSDQEKNNLLSKLFTKEELEECADKID